MSGRARKATLCCSNLGHNFDCDLDCISEHSTRHLAPGTWYRSDTSLVKRDIRVGRLKHDQGGYNLVASCKS